VTCLAIEQTHIWQAGRPSTFVMPVMEIERTIARLNLALQTEDIEENWDKLSSEVYNWQEVLAAYRSHSNADAVLFSADDELYNTMVNDISSIDNLEQRLELLAQQLTVSSTFDVFQNLTTTFYQLKSVCGDLSAYSKSVKLCNYFSPDNWNTIFKTIASPCKLPLSPFVTNEDNMTSSHEKYATLADTPIFGRICQVSEESEDWVFSFLKGSSKTLTFSADAPLLLRYTSTVASTLRLQSSYEELSATSQTVKYVEKKGNKRHLQTKVTRSPTLSNAVKQQQNDEAALSETTNLYATSPSVAYSSNSGHKFERTVTVTLGDDDPGKRRATRTYLYLFLYSHVLCRTGDYFVVQISEDPLYGTPIFKTVGGYSKCPSEVGTEARESGVTISRVVPYCGKYRNSTCENLTPGSTAQFGVHITNLSPTG
jgi:hypothetical protein